MIMNQFYADLEGWTEDIKKQELLMNCQKMPKTLLLLRQYLGINVYLVFSKNREKLKISSEKNFSNKIKYLN